MNNAELNAGVNHSRNCTMLDRDPTELLPSPPKKGKNQERGYINAAINNVSLGINLLSPKLLNRIHSSIRQKKYIYSPYTVYT